MTIQEATQILSNMSAQSQPELSVDQLHAVLIALTVLRSLSPSLVQCFDEIITLEKFAAAGTRVG